MGYGSKRVAFWIVAILASTSLLMPADFTPLVGRWTGAALPVNSFVPRTPIAIDLAIAPDGGIRGTAGDAVIVSGSVSKVPRGVPRLFTHADYVLDLVLQGNLIEIAGIQRSHLKIYATQAGPEFQAFAATDGSKLYPGASIETMKNGMRIQTRMFVLERR